MYVGKVDSGRCGDGWCQQRRRIGTALCAAILCGVDPSHDKLNEVAAQIGSDVPFFMGQIGQNNQVISAVRARGRGEKIVAVPMCDPLHFVVVFPPITLSTALVYAESQVPRDPQTAERLIAALRHNNGQSLTDLMLNRLQEPAKIIAPQIEEILKSMWRHGLRTCQLTGSGSACFAVASSAKEAKDSEQQIRGDLIDPLASEIGRLGVGVRAKATSSVTVPAEVELIPIR